MKFRSPFIAITIALFLSACGALSPTSFQANKSGSSPSSVLQGKEKSDEADVGISTGRGPEDSGGGSPGPAAKSGGTSESTGGSTGKGSLPPGDAPAYAPGPGGSSPSASGDPGDTSPAGYKKKKVASAGDVKPAKSDPEEACMVLGPVAYAKDFKATLTGEDRNELLSRDEDDPTPFELWPGKSLSGLFLIQAQIPVKKAGCGDAGCWKGTGDLPGFARIIEKAPSGESRYIDIPVDLQFGLSRETPKSFSTFAYNLDVEDLPVRTGSVLQFYYYLNPCVGELREPPNPSRTLQPYTKEVESNFAKEIGDNHAHAFGYLSIDLPPMMIEKQPNPAADVLKDADKAAPKK